SVQLLLMLTTSTGVPSFVISSTAPLVQKWFSQSRHEASQDPYFLYSASNAGSLLALIAYPFIIEPRIGVAAQTRLWGLGYRMLFLLLVVTVAALHQLRRAVIDRPYSGNGRPTDAKARLFWVGAAFVPSALMLAVTNHIAANVGSVPFLWIVPLALYLLTFILAFARRIRATSERI